MPLSATVALDDVGTGPEAETHDDFRAFTTPGSTSAAETTPDQAHELLRELRSGHTGRWKSVMGEYGPRLRSLGRSYRLTDNEIDDALQTTWLALLTHADQIRDPDCLGAWLATTMRRACLSMVNRGRNKLRLVDDWTPYEDDQAGADNGDALLEWFQLSGLTSDIWKFVEALPARQRTLIRVLFSADEPSYAEVSARTGMPIGAIGPTRQRALRRLRQVLDTAHYRVD
jgi:RNA polymerase sigma factor (sigma-70 family)